MIKHTQRQKFGIVRLGEKGKYPTFGFDSVVVRRSKTLVVMLPPVGQTEEKSRVRNLEKKHK